MYKTTTFFFTIGLPVLLLAAAVMFVIFVGMPGSASLVIPRAEAASSLFYQFSKDGTLHETGTMSVSSSPYFWLNSGGKLILDKGIGKTIQGMLTTSDRWQLEYLSTNPLDTANGYLPQNLFRLVTKSTWQNLEQSVKFNISKLNLTNTPNRGGYSGVLLMSRYQDDNNLYYAGIRFDGTAVIKKKYRGTYYTLASSPAFSGKTFDKFLNPSLIPLNTWMGLKSVTVNQADGQVRIELWLDRQNNGSWQQLLSVTDIPGKNGNILNSAAHAGIRTDYSDVLFDDYRLIER